MGSVCGVLELSACLWGQSGGYGVRMGLWCWCEAQCGVMGSLWGCCGVRMWGCGVYCVFMGLVQGQGLGLWGRNGTQCHFVGLACGLMGPVWGSVWGCGVGVGLWGYGVGVGLRVELWGSVIVGVAVGLWGMGFQCVVMGQLRSSVVCLWGCPAMGQLWDGALMGQASHGAV